MSDHLIATEQTHRASLVWQFRCSCGWTLPFSDSEVARQALKEHQAAPPDAADQEATSDDAFRLRMSRQCINCPHSYGEHGPNDCCVVCEEMGFPCSGFATPAERARAVSDWVDEIEARANAATEGPWRWWNLEGVDQGWAGQGPDLNAPSAQVPDKKSVIASWGHDAWGLYIDVQDAEFIAHAREDVPRLIAEIRRLRDQMRMGNNDPDVTLILRDISETGVDFRDALGFRAATPAAGQRGEE